MRRLLLKISASDNDNSSRGRLENTIKLIGKYDLVHVDFEQGDLDEIFEILRQVIYANTTSTLMVYIRNKTRPEGYDEITV
ncbi:MAG: hypothetical protein QW201_01320 [Thermoproteota archaeon]